MSHGLAALVACGGEKSRGGPRAAATKITITPTTDAAARPYLTRLCPKPIGGELNFMV